MPGLIEFSFLVIAVLLVLSVVSSKLSDRFGVPSLLIFLIIGILAGSEGLGGIYFDDPQIAQAIGLFALASILILALASPKVHAQVAEMVEQADRNAAAASE